MVQSIIKGNFLYGQSGVFRWIFIRVTNHCVCNTMNKITRQDFNKNSFIIYYCNIYLRLDTWTSTFELKQTFKLIIPIPVPVQNRKGSPALDVLQALILKLQWSSKMSCFCTINDQMYLPVNSLVKPRLLSARPELNLWPAPLSFYKTKSFFIKR